MYIEDSFIYEASLQREMQSEPEASGLEEELKRVRVNCNFSGFSAGSTREAAS